jgi:two-component system CheB/CheR fusion protein
VKSELRAVTRQAAELSNSLRTVSHRLHSSVIADLGIESALRSLIEEHRNCGEDVGLEVENIPNNLPFEVAVALYRIVQEGLRNASKHAAGAHVQVKLALTDKALKLSIEDSGPGFDLIQVRRRGGLGLLSIQERARLAGGTFMLRTGQGHGTSLVVQVPVEISQRHAAQS